MSIKTRRILFYSFVALFIILGTLLVLTSGGLRFDFDNFQIVETGGTYVSSTPVDTDITFDNKRVKNKAGLFQKGTLISGVVPGEHTLSIEKEKYSSWTKNFDVESSEVAVFDSIILVPNEGPKLEETLEAEDFVILNGNIVLQSGGGILINDEIVFGHKIIEFTPDNYLLTQSTETGNYYLTESSSPEEGLNISSVFNRAKINDLGLPGSVQIKDIEPYPNNGSKFVITTDGALYTLDAPRGAIEQVALGDTQFTISGNDIVWVDEEGINTFNLLFGTHSVLMDIGDIPSGTDLAYLVDGQWFALTFSNELVLLGEENIDVVSGVLDVYINENSDKLVFSKSDGLYLYSPKDMDAIQLKLLNTPIQQLDWFDNSSHIIALSGGTLNFIEIDRRSPINSVEIANNIKAFNYEDGDDHILLLNDTGIWRKDIRL